MCKLDNIITLSIISCTFYQMLLHSIELFCWICKYEHSKCTVYIMVCIF